MPTGYPIAFYLSCLMILVGLAQGWAHRREGWGLPAMAIHGTAAVWYIGDVLYNDYGEYNQTIGPAVLDSAWWQVLLFLIACCVLAPAMHNWFNASMKGRTSMLIRYFETRELESPRLQASFTSAARGLYIAWAVLMAVALIRVKGDAIGLFAPYIHGKADPWGRDRIGSGFDSFIALAAYIQVFLTAGAGVIAAISRHPVTRALAIMVCFLTLPSYIFDRTRNTMLATILPGLLAWIFLRLRGGLLVKTAVLAAAFMVVNFWFSFVIANRTNSSIVDAASSSEFRSSKKSKHEGLNMFEELGWISKLIQDGTYKPNFGTRYFAELVNPIPRVLWKSKPEIGIDYAIARGQGGGAAASGGVFASVSTGMIGQGVVNFGPIGGPIAAALLMTSWAALLARQDLLGRDLARLLLYACGMTLTFNLGRDITLLVVYPFLFGLLITKIWQNYQKRNDESGEHGGGPRQRQRPRGGRQIRRPRHKLQSAGD